MYLEYDHDMSTQMISELYFCPAVCKNVEDTFTVSNELW